MRLSSTERLQRLASYLRWRGCWVELDTWRDTMIVRRPGGAETKVWSNCPTFHDVRRYVGARQ